MADIQLSRPAANQTQTVTSSADARFVLNFNAGEAKLAKSDNGENLIITFEDGAKIEVEGFYTAFTKDNLPTLNVGGQDFSGDQLTAILGEDLMPAAGPASSGPASAGGSNATFANFSLDEGIDRIGGLDIGFSDADNLENTLEGAGVFPSPSGTVAAAGGVTPEPTPAPTPTPPTPSLIAQDDPRAVAVMNSLSVDVLSNDTLGSVAPTGIAGINVLHSSLPTGVTSEYDKSTNTLNLQLDGEAMLGERKSHEPFKEIVYETSGLMKNIPDAKYTHVADRVINYAKELKPLDGEYSVEYTAIDTVTGLTSTAVATFRVGDNTGDMSGGADADTAWMRNNSGNVETRDGADIIMAMNNRAGGTIDAGAGNDTIIIDSSEAGSTVYGGSGADWINFSGTNAGLIDGGSGSETGERNPVPYRFNDNQATGGVVYDGNLITVYENAGVIRGGINGDVIDVVEGSANDASGNATNTIEGGAGNDRLVLRGGSSYMDGGAGDDWLQVQGDDNEHQWDRVGHSVAKLHDAQYATLKGGAGDDTLKASDASHSNVLYGDDEGTGTDGGSDRISLIDYTADNTVYAGGGDDIVHIYNYASGNTVYGGAGDDKVTISGSASGNTVYGEAGDDKVTISGSASGNTVYGGADNDIITVKGSGGNTLLGEGGADSLYGGSGADYLDGGEGSDCISGGAGNDIIVYDAGDKYINGGDGIDFVLSDNNALTMDDLLKGVVGTKAQNVEVLIKGADALNITSIEQMASEYGITVSGNKITLNDNQWDKGIGNSYTYTDASTELTLEASITVQLTTGG